jgi:hypothetical protein
MAYGPALWALHFAALYGFTALACARGFAGAVPWVIAAATLAIAAAATADGDADPRNNFYVDRNQVKAAKGKKSSSKKEAAPPTLAEQTSQMPEVIAPPLGSISAADAKKWAKTFGGICRIALS